MLRWFRHGALFAIMIWPALMSAATAQPAGTWTCSFKGARYVGTGWAENGRKFAHTHTDMGVAQGTARNQCQADYRRDGLDPTLIQNACILGPCDFKSSAAPQQQQQQQRSQMAPQQQIDPKVLQLCNSYADSVVQHYQRYKQAGCTTGLLTFPVDRAKHYNECTGGTVLLKKKFDPKAGDYLKLVAAGCAKSSTPLLQANPAPAVVSRQGQGRFIVNQLSGRCLDVAGEPGVTNGTALTLANCETSGRSRNGSQTDQRWELLPGGFLRNTLSGKCVDVAGAPGVANRARIQLWDCEMSGRNANGTPTDQQWEMTSTGHIRNRLSGKCIDVPGAPGVNHGLRLELYPCEVAGGPTDQLWRWR